MGSILAQMGPQDSSQVCVHLPDTVSSFCMSLTNAAQMGQYLLYMCTHLLNVCIYMTKQMLNYMYMHTCTILDIIFSHLQLEDDIKMTTDEAIQLIQVN